MRVSKPQTTKRLRALRHSQQASGAAGEGGENYKGHDEQCGDVSTSVSDPDVPTNTRVDPTTDLNCRKDWYVHNFMEPETAFLLLCDQKLYAL